jgi:dephospho-CoA kinase
MYKVGITGGIGTGKSIVCSIFSVLGIPIYDADSRAKWLTEHDPLIRKALITAFGSEVFNGNTLNRSFLATAAFSNESKTQTLNAIIHPVVATDFAEWVLTQQGAPYVLKEAALLYESGSAKELDTMIVVSAPMELRLKRVLKRDSHRTEKQIRDIIARQWSEDEKLALANHIVYNDELQLLVPQVLALHQQFLANALS